MAVLSTAVRFLLVPGICRLFANDVDLYPYALQYYRYFLFS